MILHVSTSVVTGWNNFLRKERMPEGNGHDAPLPPPPLPPPPPPCFPHNLCADNGYIAPAPLQDALASAIHTRYIINSGTSILWWPVAVDAVNAPYVSAGSTGGLRVEAPADSAATILSTVQAQPDQGRPGSITFYFIR